MKRSPRWTPRDDRKIERIPDTIVDFDKLAAFYDEYANGLDTAALTKLLKAHSDKYTDDEIAAMSNDELKEKVKMNFSWRDCEAWQNCADKWKEYLYKNDALTGTAPTDKSQEYGWAPKSVPVNTQPNIADLPATSILDGDGYLTNHDEQKHQVSISGQHVATTQEAILPAPKVPGREKEDWEIHPETAGEAIGAESSEQPFTAAPAGTAEEAKALGYGTYPEANSWSPGEAGSPSEVGDAVSVPKGEISVRTSTEGRAWNLESGVKRLWDSGDASGGDDGVAHAVMPDDGGEMPEGEDAGQKLRPEGLPNGGQIIIPNNEVKEAELQGDPREAEYGASESESVEENGKIIRGSTGPTEILPEDPAGREIVTFNPGLDNAGIPSEPGEGHAQEMVLPCSDMPGSNNPCPVPADAPPASGNAGDFNEADYGATTKASKDYEGQKTLAKRTDEPHAEGTGHLNQPDWSEDAKWKAEKEAHDKVNVVTNKFNTKGEGEMPDQESGSGGPEGSA